MENKTFLSAFIFQNEFSIGPTVFQLAFFKDPLFFHFLLGFKHLGRVLGSFDEIWIILGGGGGIMPGMGGGMGIPGIGGAAGTEEVPGIGGGGGGTTPFPANVGIVGGGGMETSFVADPGIGGAGGGVKEVSLVTGLSITSFLIFPSYDEVDANAFSNCICRAAISSS